MENEKGTQSLHEKAVKTFYYAIWKANNAVTVVTISNTETPKNRNRALLGNNFDLLRHQFFSLEQRQYKNNSTEFRCMLILNLPPCFAHRIAE